MSLKSKSLIAKAFGKVFINRIIPERGDYMDVVAAVTAQGCALTVLASEASMAFEWTLFRRFSGLKSGYRTAKAL